MMLGFIVATLVCSPFVPLMAINSYAKSQSRYQLLTNVYTLGGALTSCIQLATAAWIAQQPYGSTLGYHRKAWYVTIVTAGAIFINMS
jgi:hypothetical protein